MIKGFIAGAFDVIHPGYIAMFEEAKANCDILCIGLHKDPSLERPSKLGPVLNYFDRFKILTAIKYIDQIHSYDTESDLVELLRLIKPDVRFLGDDYKGVNITGAELNIPLHYLDRSHEWSTTKYKILIYNQIKSRG